MKRTRFARMAVLLCAAAVLVLQGCGGGDDSGVSQDMHDMLQTELDAALADKEAAEDAKTAAEEGQTAAEAERDEANSDRDAAVMSRDEANIALGAAQQASDAAMQAQMDAEGARDTAMMAQTMLQGQLDAANTSVADFMAQIGSAADAESLQGMLAAAETAVTRLEGELKTATDDLGTANTALKMATDDLATANAALKMATDDLATAQADLKKANDDLTAAMVEIGRLTDVNATALDEENRKKRVAKGMAAQAAIDMNRVGVLADMNATRTRADAEDALRTDRNSSDVDAVDVQLPFDTPGTAEATRQDVMATRGADNLVRVQVRTRDGTEEDFEGEAVTPGDTWSMGILMREEDGGMETVAVYTDIEAPTLKSIANPVIIMAEDREEIMLDISDRDTLAVISVALEDGEMVTGTYDGVQGTFTCVTMCSFDIGENMDTLTGTDVTFQPAEPTVYEADSQYAYFGWWLRVPGDDDGDSMMIESFAGGTTPVMYTAGETPLAGIIGQATYEGSAGGKYVVETGQDDTADAEVGHFDAAVTLSANFDPVEWGRY